MHRLLSIVLFCLAASGCIQPKGEWEVVRGSDFPDEKIETLQEHQSTAGSVIQTLGVPYTRRDETFIYAVRRERPVERSYLFYQTPLTQEVTIETTILFVEGYVNDIETKRYERLLPRTP